MVIITKSNEDEYFYIFKLLNDKMKFCTRYSGKAKYQTLDEAIQDLSFKRIKDKVIREVYGLFRVTKGITFQMFKHRITQILLGHYKIV